MYTILNAALAIAIVTSASCGVPEPVEENISTSNKATATISSPDAGDSRMTWTSKDTEITDFGQIRALVAKGPDNARVQINLLGVTSDGEIPVVSDSQAPAMQIVFELVGTAQSWLSQPGATATVKLEPLSVTVSGVQMKPNEQGENFTLNLQWK